MSDPTKALGCDVAALISIGCSAVQATSATATVQRVRTLANPLIFMVSSSKIVRLEIGQQNLYHIRYVLLFLEEYNG